MIKCFTALPAGRTAVREKHAGVREKRAAAREERFARCPPAGQTTFNNLAGRDRPYLFH